MCIFKIFFEYIFQSLKYRKILIRPLKRDYVTFFKLSLYPQTKKGELKNSFNIIKNSFTQYVQKLSMINTIHTTIMYYNYLFSVFKRKTRFLLRVTSLRMAWEMDNQRFFQLHKESLSSELPEIQHPPMTNLSRSTPPPDERCGSNSPEIRRQN